MIEIFALLLIPLIATMFVMFPVWVVVVTKYFHYLRDCQPDLYKEMGEPSLFANNTPLNNISFLRYVCGNKYFASEDENLISKSLFLKKFFYTYLTIFLTVIIGVASVTNS